MHRLLLLPVLAAALTGCGSSAPVFEPAPLAAPPTIDADASDWDGALRLVDGERGLSMGLRNDADALYMAVVVRDAGKIRQIARSGLTVWLDPTGEGETVTGFRFPVGIAGGQAPLRAFGDDGEAAVERAQPGGRRDPDAMRERIRERLERAFDEVEILAAGAEDGVREVASADTPFALQGAFERDVLTIEARIPLRDADALLDLGAAPGDEIRLMLSTPTLDLRGRPAADDASRPRGGQRGRLGGAQPGVGGERPRAPRRRFELPEPIDVDVRVPLRTDRRTDATR